MSRINLELRSKIDQFLHEKITSYTRNLINCTDPNEIPLLQGKIQALQMLETEIKNLKVVIEEEQIY